MIVYYVFSASNYDRFPTCRGVLMTASLFPLFVLFVLLLDNMTVSFLPHLHKKVKFSGNALFL